MLSHEDKPPRGQERKINRFHPAMRNGLYGVALHHDLRLVENLSLLDHLRRVAVGLVIDHDQAVRLLDKGVNPAAKHHVVERMLN